MLPAPIVLRAHAHELAKAFDVRLVETARMQPENAMSISLVRVALVSPVIDETTYAVALHEIGHLAAPLGAILRCHGVHGDYGNLLRVEEDAAWAWARHYALEWTPVMDALAHWAEGTYDQAGRPAPPTPVASKPTINWNDWK